MNPELEEHILSILNIPSRLDKIESDLSSLHTKIDTLLDARKSEYVTIEDICKHFERSREWIRTHPWTLPNFGIPDTGIRPKKWHRSTWETWLENLTDHRHRWENMPFLERTKYIQGGKIVVQV